MSFASPFRSLAMRAASSSSSAISSAPGQSARQLPVSASRLRPDASRRTYATSRTVSQTKPKTAASKEKKEEEDFSVQSLDGKIADGQRQAQDLKRLDIDWLSMSLKVVCESLLAY